MKSRRINGFTLLEILIVMTILGLSFSVAVKGLGVGQENVSTLDKVNSFLDEQKKISLSNGIKSTIYCNVFLDMSLIDLIKVNNKKNNNDSCFFNIYPSGHMDNVIINFNNGDCWQSQSLIASFKKCHVEK
ncbi:MAG: type II secretion system protein [Minisyncoccales bacterium]